MNNVFPIPDSLNKKVRAVADNRKPGQQIKVNAVHFVHANRGFFESWLEKLAEEKASSR